MKNKVEFKLLIPTCCSSLTVHNQAHTEGTEGAHTSPDMKTYIYKYINEQLQVRKSFRKLVCIN